VDCGDAGACAYMLDTRAPMGMHPASASISKRQRRIFKIPAFRKASMTPAYSESAVHR